MKNKLLLFLAFISFIGYSQNPTRFPNGVQITGGQPTVTSVNFLTTVEANGILGKIDPVLLPLSTATINAINVSDANVLHKTGNESATDTKTFDNIKLKIQPIGSNLYKLRQDMSFDDWWSIYGEGSSSEKGIMVFEVGDNGEPFSALGQKFSFRYNANSSGVAKTVFEIDYNEITANANIGIGISPQAEIHAYSMSNTENIIDAPNGSSVFTMTSASLGASFVGFSNKLVLGKVTGFGTAGFSEFLRLENNGNLLIGTSIDDLTNKLQVNGSAKIISLSGTGTRQVVADASGNLSTAVIDSRPYKVYTALISQTGTNAPTATILENTLGGTVVFGYSGVGSYTATLSGAFVSNKTAGLTGNNLTTTQLRCSAYRIDNDTCGINSTTYLGVATDGALNATLLEIRVYN